MTQHIRDDASYSKVEEDSRRSIHLIDCMQLFTEEETLGKDDAWYTHTHTQSVPENDSPVACVPLLSLCVCIPFWHLHCQSPGIAQSARSLCKPQRSLISGSSPIFLSSISRDSPTTGTPPPHIHSQTITHTSPSPTATGVTSWITWWSSQSSEPNLLCQ